jgi:hypothetical protein
MLVRVREILLNFEAWLVQRGTARSSKSQPSQLDRLYRRVVDDLDTLLLAVGLKPHDTPAEREQNPRYASHKRFNGPSSNYLVISQIATFADRKPRRFLEGATRFSV